MGSIMSSVILKYYSIISFIIFIVIRSSICDICQTCLCSDTVAGPIINCHEKQLRNNDMLNFDLFTLNEQQLIHELIISQNDIIALPKNTFKKLKHLKKLDLSANLIDKIYTDVFIDLISLEDLKLSYNHLSIFDSSVLDAMSSLSKLNLSHNNINTLEGNIQYDTKLQVLDLSYNDIINLPIKFVESIQNVEYLDLSFNKILSLESCNLIHFHKLIRFHINNNHLTSINMKEIPKSIAELHAGYNLITNISYEISQIQILHIAYNYISEIETDIMLLNNLECLNFSGNMLLDFPNVKLKNLKTLDLSYNNLSTIPISLSTENFLMLDTLIISGNPIQEIKFHSKLRLRSFTASNMNLLKTIYYDALSKLENRMNNCINLTITDNRNLISIHEKTLEHMNICSLKLNDNHFTYISQKLFKSSTGYKLINEVNLQGNPFHCNCSLQWMQRDLIPQLYTTNPELLDDLRCSTPSIFSNKRMVHWYKWHGDVFCDKLENHSAQMVAQLPSASREETIVIDSSTGLLAVLGVAISVFTILVIIGILLTQKLMRRRRRINRKF